MKRSEKFFKTIETPEGDITLNGIEVKKIGASRVEIRGNEYYITPELQKIFTNSSGAPIQNLKLKMKLFLRTFQEVSIIEITHHNVEKYLAVLIILITISIAM